MVELDDLESGTEVDLWDHKLAAEMRVLQEIFAEVVDKNTRIADNGRVLDPQGRVVKNYSDTGLPAFLEFEIDSAADYFTLDVNNTRVHQPLSDAVRTPPQEAPTLEPVNEPPPARGRRGRAKCRCWKRPSRRAGPGTRPPLPQTPPPVPQAKKEPPPAAKEDDEDDALWKASTWKWNRPGRAADVNLEEPRTTNKPLSEPEA